MKTFKQFQEETKQLDEIAPLALIPAALKLGGAALSAYSAYSAAKNLRKGKYKQAGLDALGQTAGTNVSGVANTAFPRGGGGGGAGTAAVAALLVGGAKYLKSGGGSSGAEPSLSSSSSSNNPSGPADDMLAEE